MSILIQDIIAEIRDTVRSVYLKFNYLSSTNLLPFNALLNYTALEIAKCFTNNTYRHEASIHTLAYTISRNKLLKEKNYWIKRRIDRPTENLKAIAETDQLKSNYGIIEQDDTRKALLKKALSVLSEKEQTVIKLRYSPHDILSYADISKITDINETTLKVIVHRAQKKMQDYIHKIKISK